MRSIVTYEGIDEAIKNLRYTNRNSLKSKLISTIRDQYRSSGDNVDSVKEIDTDFLVKTLWETGDDHGLIRSRRKNYNSIKSTVNSDLKKLYSDGLNKEGIIINQKNIFDMSEEAKSEILESFSYGGSGSSQIPLDKITDVLSVINEFISNRESGIEENATFEQLKELIRDISGKVGISIVSQGGVPTGAQPVQGEGAGEAVYSVQPQRPVIIQEEELEEFDEDDADIIEEPLDEVDEFEEMPEEELLEDEAEDEIIDDIEEVPDEELEEISEDEIEEEEVDADEVSEEEVEEDVDEEVFEIIEEPVEGLIDDVGEIEEVPEEEIEELSEEEAEGEIIDDIDDIEEMPDEELEQISEDETEEEEVDEIEEEAIDEIGDDEYEEVDIEEAPEEELEEADEDEVEIIEEPAEEALDDVGDIEEVPDEELEEISEDETEEEEVDEIEEEAIDEIGDDEYEEVDIEEAPEEELEEADEDEVDIIEEPVEEALDDVDELEEVPEDEIDDLMEDDDYILEEILNDYDATGYISEEGQEKALILADRFDKMLSDTERYYNRYLLIPEGRFLMVNTSSKTDIKNQGCIELPEFYFGKFPVTNHLFELFTEKTGYVTTAERLGYGTVYKGRLRYMTDDKSGKKILEWNSSLNSEKIEGACWFQPLGPGSTLHGKRNHPVVQVTLEDAMAFAAWTGKRLPTEQEWEAAARTTLGLDYPWGKMPDNEKCNIEASAIGGTTPVDKYQKGANKYEIYDLIGNVMEWTGSSESKERDILFVAKGGSWVSGENITLTARSLIDPKSPSNILGFRCIAYNK